MDEVTSNAVGTVPLFMEELAVSCPIILVDVVFLFELFVAVRVSTLYAVVAELMQFPVSTNFCFIF